MSIVTYPAVSGGTDWSKYKPLPTGGSIVMGPTFKTVISVSGEGFLSKAVIAPPANGAHDARIRITLDGIVMFDANTTSSSSPAGIVMLDQIIGTSNMLISVHTPTTYLLSGHNPSLPYIASPGQGCSKISSPLFFKQSLLIEVLSDDGAIGNLNVEVSGGVA